MMHAILLMMMLFSFHLRVGLLQTRILYRLLTCDGLSCDFVIIKSCIFCVLYIRLFNIDDDDDLQFSSACRPTLLISYRQITIRINQLTIDLQDASRYWNLSAKAICVYLLGRAFNIYHLQFYVNKGKNLV